MYNHNNHWENILLYARCDCGVDENSTMTAGQLAKLVEEKKASKEYPEFINKGERVSELQANPI